MLACLHLSHIRTHSLSSPSHTNIAGSSSTSGAFYDVGSLDQRALRGDIRGVCSFAESPAGVGLRNYIRGNFSGIRSFLNISSPLGEARE